MASAPTQLWVWYLFKDTQEHGIAPYPWEHEDHQTPGVGQECLVGLEVPAAPRLVTLGHSSWFFVGLFWFLSLWAFLHDRLDPGVNGEHRTEGWVWCWDSWSTPRALGQSWLLEMELLAQRGGMGWKWMLGMRSWQEWAGASAAPGSLNLPVGAVASPERTNHARAVGFAGWTGNSLGSHGFNSTSQLWVAILIPQRCPWPRLRVGIPSWHRIIRRKTKSLPRREQHRNCFFWWFNHNIDNFIKNYKTDIKKIL